MKLSIHLNRSIRTTISAALLGALTLAPASFAEVSSTGLHFASRAELGAAKLTVTGPAGAVYEMTFAADEAPSFGLFDEAGYALEDGSYTYELRFALRNAGSRPEGADAIASGKTSTDGTVESGHFTVNGG